MAWGGPFGLGACSRPAQPLRVASISWIGYELLFLARELGYLSPHGARLVEYPSNSASLTALVNREVSVGALTLDEFLLARDGGLDLRVVLVFDESSGADVVLAGPNIQSLADIRGKRIAVESSAVGALMMAKLLDLANLTPADIVKVDATLDRHLQLYQQGGVDAVITFEPVASQLTMAGAHVLLDSSLFPGLIVDVLAVHPGDMDEASSPLRALTAAYFRALAYWRDHPRDAARLMAPHLHLTPEQVMHSFAGIRTPDLAGNRAWLGGVRPRLLEAAETVGAVMQRNRLIKQAPRLDDLCESRFLPEVA
ncbi:MAG TPA: ABC transporter substrate-binding protein [Aquabacterium sp.]|nr:ABC transporter substrate-binding protein [Aquabacterium sp.]